MTTSGYGSTPAFDAEAQSLGEIIPAGREYQSLYGYPFVVGDRRWRLSKDVVLHLTPLLAKLEPSKVGGFLATLVHFARTASGDYTFNLFDRYRHMVEAVGGDLTTTALINYRSTLNRRTEFYLVAVRSFIYKWNELGYPGVDRSVMDLLRGWTLRGNIKGDAVQRRDPEKGDLTENEVIAFNEGAARAFECGWIRIDDLALALLISCTGRRPKQISHMKLADVEMSAQKLNGELQQLIQIPRAKQQGASFRASFNTFRPSRELWVILQVQRRHCIQAAEEVLGCALDDRDRRLLPLFPDFAALRSCASLTNFRILASTDNFHITRYVIREVLNKVVRASQCFSERTGELLFVSSRRFRYSVGTRAARQGIGIAGIAELLDHSDTQSAHVCVKNIPEHVAAIDAAVGHQLAPYAAAFQGVLVDSDKDAKRGDDPANRIRYRGSDAATCGKEGRCGANVPIPCYTCMHFQPWLEGPHETVYADLLAARARILEETGDETIAAINDRTILAVAEVIGRCKARREELSLVGGV